jgi:hypothetical protein
MRISVNPWVAVSLVALAIVASVVFSLRHIPEAGIPTAILAVALALLQGGAHQETRTELVTLQRSLRPAREPTHPDIEVPKDPPAKG